MKKPRLSVIEYIKQFQQTMELPEELLISGIALIKRISNKNVKITHKLLYKYCYFKLRLFIICIIISEKLYSDDGYSLEDFSLVSAISIK